MWKSVKEIISWVLIAFLVGMALDAGRKTVNYLWPDKQTTITHKIESD